MTNNSCSHLLLLNKSPTHSPFNHSHKKQKKLVFLHTSSEFSLFSLCTKIFTKYLQNVAKCNKLYQNSMITSVQKTTRLPNSVKIFTKNFKPLFLPNPPFPQPLYPQFEFFLHFCYNELHLPPLTDTSNTIFYYKYIQDMGELIPKRNPKHQ